MSVEKELLKASGFKPRREYDDRQDYLAALARAVDNMSKDDFDELTNEAADWFNDAAQALNDKTDISDFEKIEDEEPEKTGSVEVEETASELEEETEKTEDKKLKTVPMGRAPRPKKLPYPPIKEHIAPHEVEFDRFGVAIGTKNASAIAMLEKGCRMTDVTESMGGTYYNVLRKLVQQGHKLEKFGDSTLKLTHKDDIKGKKEK
jgi:hypothetical protein